MSKNISKEHIIQTITETLKELDLDIMSQFVNGMNNMSDDIKNNSAAQAVLAASIAQANSIEVMTEVLYKILNE